MNLYLIMYEPLSYSQTSMLSIDDHNNILGRSNARQPLLVHAMEHDLAWLTTSNSTWRTGQL